MQKIKTLAIRASVLGLSLMALAACVVEDGHWHHWR
jgi:hypothetical protein